MGQMYNLKTCNGTFKGMIGECLFKLTRRYLVITKFFNKSKYTLIFGHNFTTKQKEFLEKYWFSIDGIEICWIDGNKKAFLYEIKTRNKYPKDLHFKPKMTYQTHKMYQEARLHGFFPKIATVWLHDKWEYNVEITEFDEKYYCIDKPKMYDRKL